MSQLFPPNDPHGNLVLNGAINILSCDAGLVAALAAIRMNVKARQVCSSLLHFTSHPCDNCMTRSFLIPSLWLPL